MTKESSVTLFKKMRDEMITPEYTYDHWYQTNKDILLFDNSITLHNRKIENDSAPERIGYRIQYDFDNLTGGTYLPFYQDEYNQHKLHRLDILKKATEGMEVVS